jgi:hypothetical protein
VTGLQAAPRRLVNLAGVLGIALRQWEGRDSGGPGRRQTANEAMAVIDDMIAALHEARGELQAQMRAYDDATAARADQLLDEARARREEEGR